jgi:hypothetical protein
VAVRFAMHGTQADVTMMDQLTVIERWRTH